MILSEMDVMSIVICRIGSLEKDLHLEILQ